MSTALPLSTAPQTEAPTRALDLRALSRLRWLEVDSSAISQLAYDPNASVLYVQMRGNNVNATTLYAQMRGNSARLYAYRGVSSETFMALVTAPSAGSYFARNIRNHYPTERIEFAVSEVVA